MWRKIEIPYWHIWLLFLTDFIGYHVENEILILMFGSL